MKSFSAIIDSGTDSDICSAACDLLAKHYRSDLDVSDMPVEHRTVILVESTSNAVFNGGFSALWGRGDIGDSDYQHTLAAFEAIGSEEVTQAIHNVFDAFPDRVPPPEREERFLLFAKANRAVEGRLE